MTRVQMTDQQLNRALAELMGYTVSDLDPEWWKSKHYWVLKEPTEERQSIGRDTEDEAWEDAPDYCNDPAASLEVQAKAIEVDGIFYLHNLSDTVEPDVLGYEQEDELIAYTLEHTVKLLTASPRERAEAAYITLKGDKGNE